MRRLLFAALAALTLGGGAAAFPQDPPQVPPPTEEPAQGAEPTRAPVPPPPPMTEEEAIAAVLVAVGGRDADRLRELAGMDEPDPWIVADALCSLGHADAAASYATASSRKALQGLPEYVAAHRRPSDDAAQRATLRAARDALGRRDFDGARATLSAVEGTPDGVVGILLLAAGAEASTGLRRWEEAIPRWRAVATKATALGWLARAQEFLHRGGSAALQHAAFPAALELWEAEIPICEELGDGIRLAATLGNIGVVHRSLGAYEKALEWQQRSLSAARDAGSGPGVAGALGNIANLRDDLGDRAAALEIYGQALEAFDALGDRAGAASTLSNLGNLYRNLGLPARALDCIERALRIHVEVGNRQGEATALGALAHVHSGLGAFGKALELHGRALAIREELRDRGGVARSLGNIGLVHQEVGAFAKALEFQERALRLHEDIGDRPGLARALLNLGVLHGGLGAPAAAIQYFDRSLGMRENSGDPEGVAKVLMNLGAAHERLGEDDRALGLLERAMGTYERIEDPTGLAWALSAMGAVLAKSDRYSEARECLDRALAVAEKAGERRSVVMALLSLCNGCFDAGDVEEARGYGERARTAAAEIGAVEAEVEALASLTAIRRRQRDPGGALRYARQALDLLPTLLGGVGEEQGAAARERRTSLYQAGLLAAAESGSPADCLLFAESGRAGALLEMLSLRARLPAVALPPELKAELDGAHGEAALARGLHSDALRRGDVAETARRRKEMDTARGRVAEAVARVQRRAKAVADVTYPRADSLPAIQSRLDPTEALVLYALTDEKGIAIVVTRKDARVVDLGPTEVLVRAATALRLDTEGDPTAAIEALRKAVVDPLALGPEVTRVLVSPDGELSGVSFAVLTGARQVAYVQSGTTYGILLEEAATRGEGVLALGDPVYPARRDANTVALLRSGNGLGPLPGSRAEAKAVGSTLLLGKDATEARFRAAVPTKPRWHAVHLACHGTVNAEIPQLSALALTPAGDDDGDLTVLEVFQMRIPADLVVLSACETGRGRIYRAEGIVGLTRAFMFAGAPRVLVSLWKVDDEATQALMREFYASWDPRDGSAGTGAAAALQRAQASVASRPEWSHPRYWAAWVLWGLPE